jgi:hypothetical protein
MEATDLESVTGTDAGALGDLSPLCPARIRLVPLQLDSPESAEMCHINRGDHQVVDAWSDLFPIPAAVAASEETGTRSSAVHLGRAAQVDRNTSGRHSGQVFVDRPGVGAPSDQQGRSGYDYDADHDSISSVTPLGHTKHDLAV